MIVLMNCALMYNAPVHQLAQDNATVCQQDVYNEVETVFELVTEEWLDIENFVPEQDGDDGHTDYSKAKTFDWYRYIATSEEQIVYVAVMPVFFKLKQPAVTSIKLSPSTPPPDVA